MNAKRRVTSKYFGPSFNLFWHSGQPVEGCFVIPCLRVRCDRSAGVRAYISVGWLWWGATLGCVKR